MSKSGTRSKRPPIILIDTEAEVLTDLALAIEERAPDVSEMLMAEIARAKSSPRGRVPADVVTMMSFVGVVDESTGAQRHIQLVYPRDADAEANRISILTPIGAGLIGMRVGQTISWPNRAGAHRSLRIVEVVQPETEQSVDYQV